MLSNITATTFICGCCSEEEEQQHDPPNFTQTVSVIAFIA
jgi:hypothetical protein